MAVGATSTWESAGPQPVNSEDPTYQDPVVNNFGAGWGIDAGRVTAVAVDPQHDDTVYMGEADGGIWKTMNGGATWVSIGDELSTQAIGAISIANVRPDTLYVGTGEAVTSQDSYFGLGVYRSTDGGATFAKVGGSLFDRKTVFKFSLRRTAGSSSRPRIRACTGRRTSETRGRSPSPPATRTRSATS